MDADKVQNLVSKRNIVDLRINPAFKLARAYRLAKALSEWECPTCKRKFPLVTGTDRATGVRYVKCRFCVPTVSGKIVLPAENETSL